MKLLTMRPIPSESEAALYAAAPDLRIVTVAAQDEQTLLAEAADADIMLVSLGGGSGEAMCRLLRAARQVRWIHTSSAGVDELLCPEFFERDFILTCGKGESVANLLAEHALALLLALTRGIVVAARQTQWRRADFPVRPTELRGMTRGIVGLGGVGRALARRAAAFDMRVIGIKAHPTPPPPDVEAVWGPDRLPDLLACADVVVLILPNTPQTLNSFGEAQLRQMKPSALLINVGRGQVVDGAALERALVEGWIAGAGLDVMPEEPWPAESPLWRLDNVLITPHIAGNSPQRAARDLSVFCTNMTRFVRGEALVGVVDRRERY
jgi:phosphoglycerate dehydrogenase-like enzyme